MLSRKELPCPDSQLGPTLILYRYHLSFPPLPSLMAVCCIEMKELIKIKN